MQNSKIIPMVIPPEPSFGGEEGRGVGSLFLFSEDVLKLLYNQGRIHNFFLG